MAGKLKVDQITNLNETGYVTISAGTSLDLSASDKAIILPNGTTGTRPQNPYAGSMRFNTTTAKVEYYTGEDWVNTDGSLITADEESTLYLVYAISNTGTTSVASPQQFSTLDEMTTDAEGVAFIPYNTASSLISWNRAIFTSVQRPFVQFAFDRTPALEKWLRVLLSPYSNWANEVSVNGTYGIVPSVGSSIGVGGQPGMNFQHNNGGTEPYDIPTLGNSGTVWGSGMYWGQIDAPTNYGGFMNQVYPHSGSGAGNASDKLLIYLDTASTPVASQYTNYLTPTGPLGNAQNFPWSYNGSSGLGGNPIYVADTKDHTIAGSWTSEGFQQNGTDRYIQVELPTPTSFDFTFALGYANGSHYSNQNRLEGSNDAVNWEQMAEWSYHNGTSHTDGYLYYGNGSHTYSNTIGTVTKWIPVNNRKAFKYWRLRGTNFNATNNYQLCTNWALLKKNVG